jgi:hypothetical protein
VKSAQFIGDARGDPGSGECILDQPPQPKLGRPADEIFVGEVGHVDRVAVGQQMVGPADEH